MKPVFIAPIIILLTCACGSVSKTYPVEPISIDKTVSAPLNKELTADTGDDIFVYGTVSTIKALKSSGPIKSTIPGAMGLPFNFSMKESVLRAKYQTDTHIYYAAPYGDISADHSMYGSVIREGDFVGIRINKETNVKEWVVDNSNWNYQRGAWSKTVWSRKMRKEDNVSFESTTVDQLDDRSTLVKITYNGYFNDLIHFSFTEFTESGKEEKEFAFDIDKDKFPVRVGIKGNVLDVTSVNNVDMRYKWIKMDLPKK